MRKMKRFAILAMAAVTALGALAMTACGTEFVHPTGIPEGAISSNGGFVVEKGDYVYFTNGMEDNGAPNQYGEPVKGALMRMKKSDALAGNDTAEIVVPYVMYAEDYTSGFYIYGDRVYFATMNNLRNNEGVIDTEKLMFKSAKLDGSDVQDYFTIEANDSVYRYVEDGDAVYLMYMQGADIHSYNTATRVDTLLAKDTSAALFGDDDKTLPYAYYTMDVTENIDTDYATQLSYNQIYRVRASATQAPYEYDFDEEYVKEYEEENDEELYVNLGEIVLDGIGSRDVVNKNGEYITNQFTHETLSDSVQPLTPGGYTYQLSFYNNEGLYFSRKEITSTDNEAEWVYYLGSEHLEGEWNSVTGNEIKLDGLQVVSKDKSHASSAFKYAITEDGNHQFVFLDGSTIKRADVIDPLTGTLEIARIAVNVEGAMLISLDNSDETYKYVYFSVSGDGGATIWRAVYDKTDEAFYEYSNLTHTEMTKPVQILNIVHILAWYPFEIIDNALYFIDNKTLGSMAYDYVSVVNLDVNGKLMNNAELAEFTAKQKEVLDYIAEVGEESATLSTAMECYFYTKNSDYFYDNIEYAVENGKNEDYLYSLEEQQQFADFVAGKEGENDLPFKEYATNDYFVKQLGTMNEDDITNIDKYWSGTLEHYEVPTETDSGLPAWAWALIGVGCALVVGAAVVFVLLRKKKAKKAAEAANATKKKRMHVDTTDDKSLNVYGDDEIDELESVDEVEEELFVETEEAVEESPAEEAEASEEEEQAPYEE